MTKKLLIIATLVALIGGFIFATSWYRGTEAERVETIVCTLKKTVLPKMGHAPTTRISRIFSRNLGVLNFLEIESTKGVPALDFRRNLGVSASIFVSKCM